MRKVVINACFGGFSLSPKGEIAYLARKGKTAVFYENTRTPAGRIDFDSYRRLDDAEDAEQIVTYTLTKDLGPSPTREQMNSPEAEGVWFSDRDIPRDDPDLVAVVEELGRKADGSHASLEVVEIPDDVEWQVEEYDGSEHIAEAHRVWR